MNKPEILKGDVKEFIYIVRDNIISKPSKIEGAFSIEYNLDADDLWSISNFYFQPFKPEMITEYFEGWRKENYNDGKWIYRLIKTTLPDDTISNHLHRIYSNTLYFNGKSRFYARTLSQFITNCIQAGIKLTWKEK